MKLSGRMVVHRVSVVFVLYLGLAVAAQCPVKKCGGGGSLLQLAAGPRKRPEGETPCKEVSSYDVDFVPGHFVCTRCDAATCDGCSVICDLASCVGEFYTQECTCEKGSGGGEGTTAFCNGQCGGGLCDAGGQACRPAEAACKPWWWCGGSPPTSFLQHRHSEKSLLSAGSAARRARLQTAQRERSARRLAVASAARRLHTARAELSQRSNLSLALPPEANSLHFGRGRFDCSSGALPPKTRDPQTFLWVERGFLVLDARSCEGSLFNHKCYCWDSVLRLRGKDPRTSEMKCDSDCSWGACEGRTCSRKPPPPLSSFRGRRVDAGVTRVDSAMDVVMEALE